MLRVIAKTSGVSRSIILGQKKVMKTCSGRASPAYAVYGKGQ